MLRVFDRARVVVTASLFESSIAQLERFFRRKTIIKMKDDFWAKKSVEEMSEYGDDRVRAPAFEKKGGFCHEEGVLYRENPSPRKSRPVSASIQVIHETADPSGSPHIMQGFPFASRLSLCKHQQCFPDHNPSRLEASIDSTSAILAIHPFLISTQTSRITSRAYGATLEEEEEWPQLLVEWILVFD